MVIGDNKHHRFFNTAGNLIRSTDLINYLGYRRSTEDGINHLQQRLHKAKTASLTIQAILHKVPNLPLHIQLMIVNACTRSTLLYGTEACSEEEMETLKSEMNKVLRRLGRQILHTSNAAANQTLQLDLGWPTVKAELQLRKVNAAFKALHKSQEGRILNTVLREAMRIGTPWTEEINDLIGDVNGNGIYLGNYSTKDEFSFTKKWLTKDHRNQMRRLEQRVQKTTGLYRELTALEAIIEPAPYITTNPRRGDEIRTIFALRAGASTLRSDLENRHRAPTSICRL